MEGAESEMEGAESEMEGAESEMEETRVPIKSVINVNGKKILSKHILDAH